MKHKRTRTLISSAWLISSVVVASACNEGSQGSQTLARSDAESKFFAVGLVTYENTHRCTATIIKHGVALTAKHCFEDSEIEESHLRKVGLNFRHASDLDGSPVFVRGNQIKKIVFDGPTNDIAYVLYDSSATSRLKLDLPLAENPSSPGQDASTAIVGFPVEEKIVPQFPKVLSKDCSFTGKSGSIPPSENDSGYDGLLFETTCEGWWGMSGGPVLGFGSSGNPEIIGVVTHTFHLTDTGDIDEGHIRKDGFGDYIRDVAISPLSQAGQLKQTLALDVDSMLTPNPEIDPEVLCGFKDSAALLSEAQNAVDFLKQSDSFDPLFWVAPGSSNELLTMFRDMIKTQNESFKDARKASEASFAWAKDLFADYDALLAGADLSRFKDLDIANLGVTKSYNECDTVACTDYGSFIVRVNEEATTGIFSKHSHEAARKTMRAVLGHELGHFILDFYLVKGKGYPSLEEAYQDQGAIKYHLTVDAIGMVLAGYNKTEFADVLNNTLTSDIFGEARLVADSADRVMCLTKLK